MNKTIGIVGSLAGLVLLVSANVAHARVDVGINIDIPGPYVRPAPVYVQPAPVYVQPQPVYVHPRPVYVQPRPVYVQPAPVYVHPQPVYVHPRRVDNHGWQHQHWNNGRRDQDRDGVPNYADRDRDGDGVANRHDRRPHNPYRY